MSPAPFPAIAVAHARKKLGRTQVLHGVDLNLQAVECVGLLGASGFGKSTLLRSVCGLESLDGKDSAIAMFGETLQTGQVRHKNHFF